MKKLILLLAISLMFSCKKEKQLEPVSTQTQPVVTTPIVTNLGKVVFYFPSKPSNYKYGDINVYINNNAIGKITMMPSGWVPNCNTQGFCLKSTNSIGAYEWKVIVSNSKENYTKTGTFTITENSCESINVSK